MIDPPDLAFPNTNQNRYPAHPKVNLVKRIFDNSLLRIFGRKPQLNKISPINKYIFKPSEAYHIWSYLLGKELDFFREFLVQETLSEERIIFIRSYSNKMVIYQNKKRLTCKLTGPLRTCFLLQIFPHAIFNTLKRNLIATIRSLEVHFLRTTKVN